MERGDGVCVEFQPYNRERARPSNLLRFFGRLLMDEVCCPPGGKQGTMSHQVKRQLHPSGDSRRQLKLTAAKVWSTHRVRAGAEVILGLIAALQETSACFDSTPAVVLSKTLMESRIQRPKVCSE